MNITGTTSYPAIRLNRSLDNGKAVHFAFKASSTSGAGSLMLETGTFGQSDYRRWALNYNGAALKYSYYKGTTNQSDTILSLAAETWYEAELRSGADGVLTAAVWQRDNPTVRADRVLGMAASDWATGSGRMYTFSACVYSGVLSLDRVEERAVVESGQRTKMANGASSSVWSHDARGQVTQEVKTIAEEGSYTTQWTYNDAGLVSEMVYPDGEVVSTDYLPQLVVDSLSGTETYVSGTQYDAEGRVTQRGLGNGLTSVYEYYEWTLDTNQPGYQQGGRLSTLVTGAFQNLAYRYDPGGNITHIVDSAATPVETLEYSYDLIDRLVSDTTNGGNTYGYDDDEGNLEQKGASTLVYADPSNHQVTQMGSNTYGYDLNGNMTARAGATLSYDAENRLVGYSGNGVSAAFLYDGDGRRVKGTVNNATTLYVNDFYEIEGTTVRKYYSAGGQRIAVRENGVLSYLLTDHLGSSTVTVNSVTLAKTGEIRYSSWGETRYSEGTTPTSLRYTGQYEEASLGIYYYGARWYDPYLNRWLQPDSIVPDPTNPLDWDRYAFVRNNPVNFIDPTGHTPKSTDECGPDGIYCTNNSSIQWDSNFKPGLSKKQKALAEQAFLHAQEDPDFFWGLYFNTDATLWENDEVQYLDIYLQYSTLHMTAEEYILGGMDLQAARQARIFYNSGDTASGDLYLADAMAPLAAAVVPLGLGHTGQYEPLSLREQLAMEEVMANPLGRPVPGVKMTDSRWPGSSGWQKMYQNVNGVHIHYNYNPLTGAYDDFKFK